MLLSCLTSSFFQKQENMENIPLSVSNVNNEKIVLTDALKRVQELFNRVIMSRS
jgi:hypothetical protein